MLLPGGEDAEVGAAEVQADAEGLALGGGDVGADLAGRLEEAEGDRVEVDAEQGALRLHLLGEAPQVVEAAEEVGALDDQQGGLVVHKGEGVLGAAVRRLIAGDLHIEGLEVGAEHSAVLGVHAAGDDDLAAAAHQVEGHDRGLGDGGGAVVVGGVGDLHAGERADQALVLEDRLERALADLRLIWRVGGVELAAAQDLVDGGGDEVVVGACAEEDAVAVGVGVGAAQRLELAHQLWLRHRLRQVELREALVGGDIDEEIGGGGDADGGEHLGPLGLGEGDIV
jgi:hypothetical protein